MAMSIAQTLLPEFDHEMATTRTLLACVPDAQAAWRPHAKSRTLGELAVHVAGIPNWVGLSLQHTVLDLASEAVVTPPFESVAATLLRFDALVASGRAQLAGSIDAAFAVPWTLKKAGHVIFSMPRLAVLRSFVMNHLIHHRGQLSVYLRMIDVPLPAIYGPTADTAP